MLDNVPEIVQVVGREVANQVFDTTNEDGEDKIKSVLRAIFTQLMSASNEIVTTATTKLKNRLYMEKKVSNSMFQLPTLISQFFRPVD